MRGWMLQGLLRNPGPLAGTLVAAATAATLTVAAASLAGASTTGPAGRLAGASVVVAGTTDLTINVGHGPDPQDRQSQSVPLTAYRGVPATLAQHLAQVPGVASATGESGFPGGVVRSGDVDLVAVTARSGVAQRLLVQRITAALHGGRGYTIVTGAARADVANPQYPVERADAEAFAGSVTVTIAVIALFVLAGTCALAVNLRWRRFALLRAVGATRGQVRRAVVAELTLTGLAGGALGWLPGAAFGALTTHALAAHQMLPPGSSAWLSPWLLMIACGSSVIVAGLGGWIAARRAGRTSPAQVLRDTSAERRWPHPVRVGLGLVTAGGTAALLVLMLTQKTPGNELELALPLLLACLVAVALLGPLLVALAAWLARPLRAAGGPSARMALAAITAQPRRTASAVIPVALAVALVGAIYFADQSITHATTIQTSQTVTASTVFTGNGLPGSMLRQARDQGGVSAVAGLAPVTLDAADPDLEQVYGVAVAGGPLTRVLNLGVTSGRLAALAPGQIALSTMEAGSSALGAHVGSHVTVYLPDGTAYRATVSAVYSRALAVGDVLIPAAVAAGHTGTRAGFGEILVSGGSAGRLAALAAGHPGVRADSRRVYNAQSAQAGAQNDFANNLVLGVVAVLAAVALVNTLVVTAVERRRRMPRLLGRLGATRGQVAAMFGWHALFVTGAGLVTGAVAGTATLLGVTRAVTGSWVPYIPPGPAAGIVATVAALTVAATLAPLAAAGLTTARRR